MAAEQQVVFGPFRLDIDNARLWRGRKALRLSPKALATLHYLVERPDRLVSKEELFTAVWPGVVVSDAALTICIGELRRVLGESARLPRFIETVPKRGYRWIAPSLMPPLQFGVRSSELGVRTLP
jgi:DNA-binding winged helix-turn-helix (wHTH) protein